MEAIDIAHSRNAGAKNLPLMKSPPTHTTYRVEPQAVEKVGDTLAYLDAQRETA